jgi:hypothetical protein
LATPRSGRTVVLIAFMMNHPEIATTSPFAITAEFVPISERDCTASYRRVTAIMIIYIRELNYFAAGSLSPKRARPAAICFCVLSAFAFSEFSDALPLPLFHILSTW